MADQLALEALSQIQALDARDHVKRFRDKWTQGDPLDEERWLEWMRGQLSAPAEVTSFCPYFGDTLDMTRARWRAEECHWNGSRDGEQVGVYQTEPHSATRELGELVSALADFFGREWSDQGAAFVLSGRIPTLRPASFTGKIRRTEGGLRNVSGPLSQELILFVRPQATLEDVEKAYKLAQQRIMGKLSLPPRERIKPVGSPLTRDRAVLGARIALGDFESWAAAMAAYNTEHPLDPTYRDDQKGQFRRDVRAAYKRVTGLDLDFQPDRRGTSARARLRTPEGMITVDTAWNAQPSLSAGETEDELRETLGKICAAKASTAKGRDGSE